MDLTTRKVQKNVYQLTANPLQFCSDCMTQIFWLSSFNSTSTYQLSIWIICVMHVPMNFHGTILWLLIIKILEYTIIKLLFHIIILLALVLRTEFHHSQKHLVLPCYHGTPGIMYLSNKEWRRPSYPGLYLYELG